MSSAPPGHRSLSPVELDVFDATERALRPDAQLLDLTIVIPMFRESARIGRTIATLAASKLHRDEVEFIFVDDGSGDATVATAESEIERLGLRHARVHALAANTGKGGAVRAGMLLGEGSHLAFLDADLSLDPDDVWRALARATASGVDVLVGERIVDESRQPKIRRLASLVFRKLASSAGGAAVADPQCAMKIFRRDVGRSVFQSLVTNGFAFDVEILARAAKLGCSVEEVKVRWEHQSGSKVNPLSDGIGMYREVLRIRSLLRA